jgi:hypothetical protein
MESSTVTRTFEKGNGTMKPSQLFIRKQRENFACIGTIGVAVNCASEIAPDPREYRGPREPSGVMALLLRGLEKRKALRTLAHPNRIELRE